MQAKPVSPELKLYRDKNTEVEGLQQLGNYLSLYAAENA
jgi:hypothetical protein